MTTRIVELRQGILKKNDELAAACAAVSKPPACSCSISSPVPAPAKPNSLSGP